MNAVLPCSADAASAKVCAADTTAKFTASAANATRIPMLFTSTRLCHDIDNRGLAGLDHLYCFLQGWRQVVRIGDRTGRPHPHRACKLRIVDRRIFQARPDRTDVVAKACNPVAS